jgi:hypothetical protein
MSSTMALELRPDGLPEGCAATLAADMLQRCA